jgi:ABC-type nitrate/sulfonate/bicarbonate transport system substrate-binding protein
VRTNKMRAAVFGTVFAASALLASAAAGSVSSRGVPTGGARANALSLSIANPTIASDLLDYVAKSKGFFDKAGVDVTIVDQFPASSTASYVVSGKADIAIFAGVTPLVVASQGQPTSIIFGLGGGGQGGMVIGKPAGISSLAELRSKQSCRIGTFAPGSSAYGWAAVYRLEFHLNCDLVPFADAASQAGALAADRVDALVGSYPNFASLVTQNQAKILIDTRNLVQRKKYTGPLFPEVVIWGLTSTLQSKRPAVVAYLKALAATDAYVQKASTADLVAVLKSYPEFNGLSDEVLGITASTIKAYLLQGGTQGFITPTQWKLGLTRYANWGVPGFDATSPSHVYGQRVDMSYYKAALGDPTVLKASFSPAQPKAGAKFSVKGTGIVGCTARLGAQTLAGGCTWKLPKNAHGKRLTVRVNGNTAHRTVTFTVR